MPISTPTISLTFDEAMRGAQRQLTVTRQETCRACRGARRAEDRRVAMQALPGSGAIRSRRGSMVFSKSCEACGGTGRLAQTVCGAATGRAWRCERDGTESDSRRRGRQGAHHGCPERECRARRRRRGRPLHLDRRGRTARKVPARRRRLSIVDVPIGVHEAALGAQDRRADARGHGDGCACRLARRRASAFACVGRGAPSPRDGERGDLVVEVEIALPRVARRAIEGTAAGIRSRINGGSRRHP